MRPITERFWEKVKVLSADECWEWQAGLNEGYGRLNKGRNGEGHIYAHQLSWILHYGEIPKGLWVLHKCDNRKCCNPNHLFLGTPQDNTNDMLAKGRATWRHKSHCIHGHELVGKNLIITKKLRRHTCRECMYDRIRKYRERKAA